jgi:hypothetical protein
MLDDLARMQEKIAASRYLERTNLAGAEEKPMTDRRMVLLDREELVSRPGESLRQPDRILLIFPMAIDSFGWTTADSFGSTTAFQDDDVFRNNSKNPQEPVE